YDVKVVSAFNNSRVCIRQSKGLNATLIELNFFPEKLTVSISFAVYSSGSCSIYLVPLLPENFYLKGSF
ncbi:MAG TPA: hypothetical protein VF610_06775, partial [Segetibacter sp.]